MGSLQANSKFLKPKIMKFQLSFLAALLLTSVASRAVKIRVKTPGDPNPVELTLRNAPYTLDDLKVNLEEEGYGTDGQFLCSGRPIGNFIPREASFGRTIDGVTVRSVIHQIGRRRLANQRLTTT